MCVRVCGCRAWACGCAHVALLVQHATSPHIVTRGFSGFTAFFYIISKIAQFSEKNVTDCKMCVLVFSTKFI